MHEIALSQAIAGTVSQRAQGRTPARVRVRIGYLRQVVPDSLVFNWEMVTAGSDLEGCVLDVDYIPAVVACAACGARTTLISRPCCAAPATAPTSRWYRVTSSTWRRSTWR